MANSPPHQPAIAFLSNKTHRSLCIQYANIQYLSKKLDKSTVNGNVLPLVTVWSTVEPTRKYHWVLLKYHWVPSQVPLSTSEVLQGTPEVPLGTSEVPLDIYTKIPQKRGWSKLMYAKKGRRGTSSVNVQLCQQFREQPYLSSLFRWQENQTRLGPGRAQTQLSVLARSFP